MRKRFLFYNLGNSILKELLIQGQMSDVVITRRTAKLQQNVTEAQIISFLSSRNLNPEVFSSPGGSVFRQFVALCAHDAACVLNRLRLGSALVSSSIKLSIFWWLFKFFQNIGIFIFPLLLLEQSKIQIFSTKPFFVTLLINSILASVSQIPGCVIHDFLLTYYRPHEVSASSVALSRGLVL